MKEIKPLYRKVNSRTIKNNHHTGSDARHDRNTKRGLSRSMKKNVQRGLDYTPLYMFLLSKVGEDFDKVHSEAIKRLDKEEPIFHMVSKDKEGVGYFRGGENSLFSSLYIDDNNTLQKINPNLSNEDLEPSCTCCTHSFNGKSLIKKQNYGRHFG